MTISNNYVEEDVDGESLSPKGPAVSYGADYTLDTIAQYVKNKDIIVQPGFQRKEVWDKNKSSKLIESFLLGYPVPNILLGRPQNDDRMEVIDGQQRIVAISSYLKGMFKDSVFRLTGDIAPQFVNKSFEELEEADQRRLRNQVLKATILVYQEEEPNLKFSVFQRINTGSVVLTQQEIRNCIYGGSLNDMLHAINENKQWRSLQSAKPDSRMRDEEAILRFYASFFDRDHYQKPMTKFLNDFMNKHQALEQEKVLEWTALFQNTLSTIMKNFSGKNPFALLLTSRQLNRAIFESVMVAVATLTKEGKTNFRDFTKKHSLLVADSDFQESVSTGTSSEKKYAQRFERALYYLK